MMDSVYVIGLDYGTDSARGLLVDALTGEEVASSQFAFPRWAEGRYCNPQQSQFRQHPLDALEALEGLLKDLAAAAPEQWSNVKAINIDCTGCSPCLCDSHLKPLSLRKEFSECPAAMFFMWKDHSSQEESDRLQTALEGTSWLDTSGGKHSPESYWSKVARALSECPELERHAYAAVEMHDYLPAVLCGITDYHELKESRATIAAKAIWDCQSKEFPAVVTDVLPSVSGIFTNKNRKNYTADAIQGYLCEEWASRTGLGRDVVVGVGHLDSWSGAVGAGVARGRLVMNLGTSSAYIAVMPTGAVTKPIDGVLCQVEDLAVPGMTGFETGLSSFGDDYAWLKKILSWASGNEEGIMERLNREAAGIVPSENLPLSTDWFNGRRSPSTDMSVKAAISGLTLATSPAELYYSIVESTAFATKAVVDLLAGNGVEISELVAIGGISHKSPFVMQMLSDVLQRPIRVSSCSQTCAYGAVLFATVNAGVYPDVTSAQNAICKTEEAVYTPRLEYSEILTDRYGRYLELGRRTGRV
ncbi:MAG: ribulokinase [Bacteroidales bacterium]|nr:ribulokinase [Bacteroidales bacterium]